MTFSFLIRGLGQAIRNSDRPFLSFRAERGILIVSVEPWFQEGKNFRERHGLVVGGLGSWILDPSRWSG